MLLALDPELLFQVAFRCFPAPSGVDFAVSQLVEALIGRVWIPIPHIFVDAPASALGKGRIINNVQTKSIGSFSIVTGITVLRYCIYLPGGKIFVSLVNL